MRSYQEHIDVRVDEVDETDAGVGDHPEPTMFVWRGRLYVIRAVLSQWRARADWWRAAQVDGSSALAAVSAPEQVVWRVEASAGRSLGTGTYDLACAPAGDSSSWTLLRVAD